MNKFNLILDASQIYEIQMCPLKWWYKHKENLQLAGLRAEALDKGTLVHNLLDLYYTRRFENPVENPFISATIAINLFKQAKYVEALFKDNKELEEFLCQRFLLYVGRYLNNDFLLTKEKAVELGFSKVLFENEDVRFIVEGRIDLICKINTGSGISLCFVDHKTQSKFDELYQYKPQFKTYAWATGYKYGMINYFGLQEDKDAKLMKEGKIFRRQLIFFEDWMIYQWETKMLSIFWKVYYLLTNHMLDSSEYKFYNERNDSWCGGAFDCNPCQFTQICETQNWDMKQKIKEFRYIKMDPWSPWVLKNDK